MKTLILNSSPKGNLKDSNTQIFIQQFITGMKTECEVRVIEKENLVELLRYMKKFEVIVMAMPLYIHAMPSRVMALIEHMELDDFKGKKMGFIIQSGFPEGMHSKYLKEYFEVLTKNLQCEYLGTVVKGDSAFIYRKPQQYVKLFEMIKELGAKFETTGQFDEMLVKQLEQPYQFSKLMLRILKFLDKIDYFNREWKVMLRENKVLDQVLDRPFL